MVESTRATSFCCLSNWLAPRDDLHVGWWVGRGSGSAVSTLFIEAAHRTAYKLSDSDGQDQRTLSNWGVLCASAAISTRTPPSTVPMILRRMRSDGEGACAVAFDVFAKGAGELIKRCGVCVTDRWSNALHSIQKRHQLGRCHDNMDRGSPVSSSLDPFVYNPNYIHEAVYVAYRVCQGQSVLMRIVESSACS
jgi:hypothetical protein